MRTPLLRCNGYDVVPTATSTLLVARNQKIIGAIDSYCAERFRILLQLLQSPAALGEFNAEVNCHGLAEFMLGRTLKWRNKPKMVGAERLQPGALLPSPLPGAYQLLGGNGRVLHSVAVLGNTTRIGDALVLEKVNGSAMRIEQYSDTVRGWSYDVVQPTELRLRYPFAAQAERKAA